jgi:hypothetical protein
LILLAPALGISSAQALALAALMFLLQLQNGIVGFGVWMLEPDKSQVTSPKSQDASLKSQVTSPKPQISSHE